MRVLAFAALMAACAGSPPPPCASADGGHARVGRVRWWLTTEKKAEGNESQNVEISTKAGVVPLPAEITDVSCAYDPVFTKEGNEMRSIECTGTGWRALTIAICSSTYQPVGARAQEPADGAASIRDVAVLLAQEGGHPFRVGLICATQPAEATAPP